MNILSNQKKILLLIFVIIIIFVLFKTSEDFVTNTESINNIASMYNAGTLTATNISATDKLKVGTNVGALQLETGAISFGNGDGYGVSIGKKGSPTMSIWDNQWTSVNGTLAVAGDITANNMRAGGTVTTAAIIAGASAPNAVSIGAGNLNFGNGDGHGLNIGKPGSPSMTVYDNRFTTVYGILRVTDPATGARMDYTATGPRAVPADAP